MTRIRFDECLSRNIVAAMKTFGLPPGIEVEHPSDCGEGGALDVDWLPAFRASGGRCIVSGDPKMRGRINERLALQEAGFVAIFPPGKRQWYDLLRRHGQAAFFFRWLPEIARLATTAAAGDPFMLPPNFDADPAAIVKLRRLSGPSAEEIAQRRAKPRRAKVKVEKASQERLLPGLGQPRPKRTPRP